MKNGHLKKKKNIGLEPGNRMIYPPRGGGVLPYMDYIGMCRCEGYGFLAVYSRIEYINHSISV